VKVRRVQLPDEFSGAVELIDREHGPRRVVILVAGTEVVRQYGPLDGPVKTSATSYDDPGVAMREAAAAIKRLRVRGYVEGERSEELEAIIARDPDDPAAYQVYADWLDARGDPRGEFITVASALDEQPESAELAAREQALLDLQPLTFADPRWRGLELYWRCGYVEGLGVTLPLDKWFEPGQARGLPFLPPGSRWLQRGVEVADWLSNIRAHPSGRFVRSLYTKAGVYAVWREAGGWRIRRTS
jgi:uncharacterized protein (TIGR02996 family)